MFIDKLDNKFNKYNNTYHRTFKMKLVDAKSIKYVDLLKKIMKKVPSFDM